MKKAIKKLGRWFINTMSKDVIFTPSGTIPVRN